MSTREVTGSKQTDLDLTLGAAVPMEVLCIRPPSIRLLGEILGHRREAPHKGGKGRTTEDVSLSERTAALSAQDEALVQESDVVKVRLAHGLLATLSPRYRLMVKLSHGIGTADGKPCSHADIGRRFGITGARVSLIEGTAKRRLASLVDGHVSLREPDDRDVLVFENTSLNPDSAEFTRLAALPLGELRSMFDKK